MIDVVGARWSRRGPFTSGCIADGSLDLGWGKVVGQGFCLFPESRFSVGVPRYFALDFFRPISPIERI